MQTFSNAESTIKFALMALFPLVVVKGMYEPINVGMFAIDNNKLLVVALYSQKSATQ